MTDAITNNDSAGDADNPSAHSPVRFERQDRVVIATIDRPDALNALNHEVMTTLVDRFEAFDTDPDVGCFVLTGAGRAFAAGADITELQQQNYRSMMATDFFSAWDRFAALRTPKVAAVAGYALGGGCELAMMCDIILAADNARFGQPEIKLGLIPGMGGTQRLTRLVGRAKAMDLILTGRMMEAAEAERAGLVARVIPTEELLQEAVATATTIAGYATHTLLVATEAVDRADQLTLSEGINFERRSYYALFDTPEAIEGMTAFTEKRDPSFHPAPPAA